MIPDKDKTVPPEVSDFIFSLIQAFLKTGYYKTDHPEAKKAMKGLYEGLQKVLKDRSEISFLSVAEGRVPEIFIVGITTDPLPVSSLMMKSMSEVFVTRFNEFFERKRLSAFTMKATITPNEFEKFISLMTESPFAKEKEEDVREKLTIDLIRNQVLAVSTIFNVDLVGKGKKLPWRVNISLSRLKKDLNMIPLFKNISKEKANEIRRLIFEDIIRPLNTAGLATDILLNLDLITNDVAGFNPDELETAIIENLNRRLLPNVARLLIDHITGLKNNYEKLQASELLDQVVILSGIAKKIALKLFDYETAEEELISRFVKCGILKNEEIPADMGKKIFKYIALDRFLQSPGDFYDEVNKTTDPAEIEEKVSLLFRYLPMLFSEGRYPDILEIMKISFSKKIPLDPEKHSEVLAQTASEIRTRTASASKEENSELLNVLSFLGSAGNYLIVDLLDNPSRYLRRQALEFLGRKGPEVIPIILAALKQRNGWFFLRNALMILAKIGARSQEVEALFRHSLQHPELNIKKEAILGIPVIAKEDGEKLLIPLLQNPDSEVRKRTAVALVALRSVHPKLLDFLIGILTDKREGREGDPAQALDLLMELDLPRETKPKLESILIEMLKGPSILARIRKEALPDNTVKSAAIRTLGNTGTLKSLTVLETYSSGKDTSLSKAAKKAIEKIRQRP